MIGVSHKGDFSVTKKFLDNIRMHKLLRDMNQYGRMGVQALSSATPRETGLTADSWEYRVIRNGRWIGIEWYNTNVVGDTPVVILIQYSHGTGTGGYVEGRDFINPAMRPLFDQIINDIWEKVRSA